MVEIKKNLVDASRYSIKSPYTMQPKYVVIHNTANDAPAANEVAYMLRNNNTVSFHYAVDDKEIVQGIPENRNAWHAGDGSTGKGNRYGISIEICWSKSGGAKFIAAEKNAAELAASILKRYGWGVDALKKHQDFNGKNCPHRTIALGWQRFVDMVAAHLEDKPAEKPAEQAAPAFEPYLIRTTCSALNIRAGAGTDYKVTGCIRDKLKYAIVAEADGKGAKKWGKLKSGAGWIALDYTKRA